MTNENDYWHDDPDDHRDNHGRRYRTRRDGTPWSDAEHRRQCIEWLFEELHARRAERGETPLGQSDEGKDAA